MRSLLLQGKRENREHPGNIFGIIKIHAQNTKWAIYTHTSLNYEGAEKETQTSSKTGRSSL